MSLCSTRLRFNRGMLTACSKLELMNNNICTEGCDALCSALTVRPKRELLLDLRGNIVGCEVCGRRLHV